MLTSVTPVRLACDSFLVTWPSCVPVQRTCDGGCHHARPAPECSVEDVTRLEDEQGVLRFAVSVTPQVGVGL